MAERADPRDERSIGSIVGDAISNLQEIVRTEIELVKTETREEAMTAVRASGLLVGGVIAALYALGLFLLAVAWALSEFMDLWLALGIVFLVMAVIAGVLIMVGKSRLSNVNPKPEQTMETLKEDVAWAKRQMS
jgi:uncharacterized membrane protein YqjE